MRRMIGVGVVLLLLALLIPASAEAQSRGSREPKFQLGLSYPNPFNPETKIPFTLLPELFEQGRPVVVSMRIRNILGQLVAIPAALDHPDGNGVKVDNLVYTTAGPKEAYWDGYDRFGRKVASAMYLLELVVNGERAPPQKLMVAN
ncbi:MAG TPA: hypothetical protein VK928_12905 [Longimicrobiales bacterium]|nr:hypothetical protein [Longimicrobiales bacterium]